MKKLIFILLVLLYGSLSMAQVCPSISTTPGTVNCAVSCTTLTATPNMTLNATSTYSVSSTPYTPYSYTTGTAITTTTDDIYTTGISIPFCFNFFGVSYNTIYMGSNGNVSFNSLISGAYDPWSITGPLPGSNCNATFNAIMSPWCDIYPPGGGSIRYATYGTAPCRAFVISYNNLTMFLPGVYCTGTLESSQIVLHETSNIIDIYIGAHNSPLCTSWNGGLAITGIENMAGTIFYTPPGQNGTVFTAINQGWRFTPNGANFPWGYVWTGPTGVVGTLSSATVCPTVSTTYTVTATTTAACGLVTISNTSLVTSVVSPVTITGPNNTCVGKTITLSSSTSSGTWSSSNTSVATVIGGIVTGVSVGTTTISYTSGSCSGSYNITVNPIYNTTLNATICQGQSYNFLGTGLTLPGVYKDTLYSIYGCDSSFTLNLNVNPTFNTNIFDTICDNQTYNFFGSVLNINGIYNHTLSTINGCDSIISLHLLVHPTYHNFTSALICQGDSYSFGGDFYNSGGNYTKNFPSVYGCDSIVTLNLTVYPKPDASFYVSPYKCIGDTITVALDHISSDVISYFWDFNPASVLYYSGLSGPYDITYNSSGIYTISLIVSNIYCTDTTKDTLQIMNYPNARIAPAIYLNGSSDVCIGDEIILQSLYKQNGWLYYWTPSYVLDDPNVAAVRATIPSDSISISLNIMNAFGCKATDSIKIKAESCCLILVPSAFTPNGDGINDIFRIINRHSIKLHSFEIVNRFGQSVFETYDLSKGWDGTFGGVPQDLGVYFYYILYECEGKQLELKGDLTLIR